MAVPPQVLALVVCDAVHQDPATGKHSLLGLLGAVTGRDFPLRWRSLGVYAAITEGYGARPMRVQVVRADGLTVLAGAAANVSFADPRLVYELAFTFPNVVFPAPEEVRVQILADDDLLMERRLVVRAHRAPPSAG